MCLIAFAWQHHPRYALVLAGNRDEFHERPTRALARWDEAPEVIGGRDELAGGTWLGVSERGRLSAVTNVRLASTVPVALRSRGRLSADFLFGRDGAESHASALLPALGDYGACNLLLFDAGAAVYAANRPNAQALPITPGLHSLSNAALDTPWPKAEALRAALANWLAEDDGAVGQAGGTRIDRLFAALASERRAPDAELPDTGVGIDRERFLSPAFIRSPLYGTRASTVVLIDRAGNGRIVERRFGPGGPLIGESVIDFRWPSPAS